MGFWGRWEYRKIMGNKMKKNFWTIAVLFAAFLLGGCTSGEQQVMDGDGMFQIDDQDDMTPNAFVTVKVGDQFFSVDLDGNSSADAFFEKLKEGDIEVEMHDYGNFEKVGELPWELPTNDEEITTKPGDLILYQGNKITVYYDENTWNFTRLGRLNGTPEEIKEVFGGEDDVTAEFFLEWTE